jgi:hypothetical protein
MLHLKIVPIFSSHEDSRSNQGSFSLLTAFGTEESACTSHFFYGCIDIILKICGKEWLMTDSSFHIVQLEYISNPLASVFPLFLAHSIFRFPPTSIRLLLISWDGCSAHSYSKNGNSIILGRKERKGRHRFLGSRRFSLLSLCFLSWRHVEMADLLVMVIAKLIRSILSFAPR